ncbi:ACP S-malonyltransferase [Kitasatospora sp. NPDC086801]|uniref:ACP S-malonyltransferase n=1 Tax=Kitasatospora sp. NPDC086801 TaxID=3364066 RepID=UPI003812E3D4
MGTDTAVVFPGMGPTRFADVAKFMLINPQARRLTRTADETLGYSLVDRYRDTPGDYSEYAQLAFLVNSLALAEWVEQTQGVRGGICAGPSFGGKAAAVYSGALSFPDAVRMTSRWARVLEDYFAVEHRDIVVQSFARVPELIRAELLRELDEEGEWYDIACHIDHDLTMVCLREGRLEWFQRRVRAHGGLPLYVMRPPMHSQAFTALRDRVEAEILDVLTFADPTIPVVADQDGRMLTTGPEVRAMLLDGFVRAVHWPQVVQSLRERGVDKVYVCGSDSLFGRVHCTTAAFEVVTADPRLALRPQRRGMAA